MMEFNIPQVLVIDDNREFRTLLVSHIESIFAVSVVEADSAADAISTLSRGQSFKLVICDYDLGLGNGMQVFQFHRMEQNGSIPFIMFTGSAPLVLQSRDYQESGKTSLTVISKPNLDQLMNAAASIGIPLR